MVKSCSTGRCLLSPVLGLSNKTHKIKYKKCNMRGYKRWVFMQSVDSMILLCQIFLLDILVKLCLLLQGRETYCFSPCVCLSVRPSVCPSVCLSVRHKSCPLYNLKTVKDFSMKLGTFVNHDESMCHAQEP